jgi:hypothetical protein
MEEPRPAMDDVAVRVNMGAVLFLVRALAV